MWIVPLGLAMKKCLPCLVHGNSLTSEEKKMLYEMLASQSTFSLRDAFFMTMMDIMARDLKKERKIISTGGLRQDGTLDIKFDAYAKIYWKMCRLLAKEIC